VIGVSTLPAVNDYEGRNSARVSTLACNDTLRVVWSGENQLPAKIGRCRGVPHDGPDHAGRHPLRPKPPRSDQLRPKPVQRPP